MKTLQAIKSLFTLPLIGQRSMVVATPADTAVTPPPVADLPAIRQDGRLAAVYLNHVGGGMPIECAEAIDWNGRVALFRFTPLGRPDPLIALPVVGMDRVTLGHAALLVNGVADIALLGRSATTASYAARTAELRRPLQRVVSQSGLDEPEMLALAYWWATYLAQPHAPMDTLAGGQA